MARFSWRHRGTVVATTMVATLAAFSDRAEAGPAQTQSAPIQSGCVGHAYAPPFPGAPQNYKPHYHTTVLGFLQAEEGVGPVTSSEYYILDALIDEAKTRLHRVPPNLPAGQYDGFAVGALTTIDCILVRHGFVYPGIGLVQLISDGLDPTTFTKQRYLEALMSSPFNVRRISFIAKRGRGPFYVVDCDIASFLYLAIGQIMGYPLQMVELPKHDFIRWGRPDGTSIDFETMEGAVRQDRDYENGFATGTPIPPAFVGKPGFLTSMTSPEVESYHDFIIAIAMTWNHSYPSAIAEYDKAISVDASVSDAENNLAWLYTVVPNSSLQSGARAVTFAVKAAATSADGDVLDTLACAKELDGDNAGAINAETQAEQLNYAPQGSNIEGDMALFRATPPRLCKDANFGTDPNPFRDH